MTQVQAHLLGAGETAVTNSLSQAEPQKLLDDLVARSLAYRTSRELKTLFEFSMRFPQLAPFNAMLLHVQNPGIRYALTPFHWERQYDRRVKVGARPYVILRTMGPVDFVFDLSDTESIHPSKERVPERAMNPFPAKGQPPPAAWPRLESSCKQLGIVIESRDLGTALAGKVTRVEGRPYDFHVLLNLKQSEAQRMGSLAHELAHIFCGHLGQTKTGWWKYRIDLTKEVEEFEAEAAACLFTLRMALDISSETYLAGYLAEDKPLPKYSLDSILPAVGKLEQMANGRWRGIK